MGNDTKWKAKKKMDHLLTHKLNNAEVAVVMNITREAVRKLRAKRVNV
jgi:hypothetical protein